MLTSCFLPEFLVDPAVSCCREFIPGLAVAPVSVGFVGPIIRLSLVTGERSGVATLSASITPASALLVTVAHPPLLHVTYSSWWLMDLSVKKSRFLCAVH